MCMIIYDLYTKWTEGHAKALKDADACADSLEFFSGKDVWIKEIYSDRAPELEAAAKQHPGSIEPASGQHRSSTEAAWRQERGGIVAACRQH